MLCCLAYSIAECKFIGHTVVGLVVEVNSVFLHLRKLMQIMHIGFQHPLYRIVCVMNLISFVVCRFAFSMILISHGLFVYRYRMSTFYFSMLMPTVVIMWVVNIVLFWRLYTNDVLRYQPVKDNDHMLNDRGMVTAVVNNNHAAALGLPSDRQNKTDWQLYYYRGPWFSVSGKKCFEEVLAFSDAFHIT